jgi:hypothetical protein
LIFERCSTNVLNVVIFRKKQVIAQCAISLFSRFRLREGRWKLGLVRLRTRQLERRLRRLRLSRRLHLQPEVKQHLRRLRRQGQFRLNCGKTSTHFKEVFLLPIFVLL